MYFKDNEFSNKSKLSLKLIHNLEAFRGVLGQPIIITADYATTGHSRNSYHYKGMAIDGTTNASLRMFIDLAPKYFTGIGIYLSPISGDIEFFHLDIREESPTMWVGVLKEDGTSNNIYNVGK